MKYEYIHPTSHWKRKKRRRLPKLGFRLPKGLFKNAFLFGLVLVIAGSLFSLAAFAWVSRDLPDPNALLKRDVAQTTKLYDRTGEHLLYEIHGDKNRTLIKLEEIPEVVKNATIAIEDQQFYKHQGFNPFRMVVGIVWGMITKGRPQGGSTITQQLVKNAILSGERTVGRKVKELMLSIAIEQRLTKDQILQLYLNEIGYGSSNYGVEAAARAYFGKSVKNVDLAEAATLAALPKAPTTYLNSPEKLDARRDLVLKIMFDEGFITESQKIDAQAEEVILVQDAEVDNADANTTPLHFVFYVKQLLVDELNFDEREVEQGGLSVITSLDYEKQAAAQQAVREGVEAKGPSYGFGDAALVAIDPKTGQVLSMVGSKDYFDEEIDGAINMTLQPVQPGSSIKPIVYTAGFLQGYTPNSILYDVITTFKTEVGDYTPHNYHLEMENGPVTVRKALQGSLNIPAVKMITLIGLDKVLDFAESLGYSTFEDRSQFGPAIVLGGGEVKLIEHAAAFGVLANGGVRQDTAAVLKVSDAAGNTLYEWKNKPGKEVVEKNITLEISNVLSDNSSRAYVFGEGNHLTLSDRPAAAKTGTTNDNRAALTVGYTPSLVAAVWVGNADYSSMTAGADGSVVAAPIWQNFMNRALQGTTVEAFEAPSVPVTGKNILDGILPSTTVVIDKSTGKLATDATPESMREEISCGEYHSELYYITPGDPLGAAPGDQPDNEQYVSWETALSGWVERTKAQDPSKLPFEECSVPTAKDDVHVRANTPSVSIKSPDNNDSINSRRFQVEIDATARRGVARVEYYIDNTFVKSSSATSGMQLTLPNWVDVGRHTLKVVAYDDVDNAGDDSVSIEVTSDAEAAVEVIDPINGQTIEKMQSTYSVVVELSDHTSISQVQLFAQGLRGDSTETIGTESSPSSPFVTFTWTLPSAGDYVLYATADGQESGQILVEVKESSSSSPNPLDLTVTTDLLESP